MTRWICIVIAALLCAACGGTSGAQAYEYGNSAYEHGEYKMAFDNYLYAAHQNVIPAQYAVGYQYYYGQGTKQDQVEGIKWLKKAAPRSQKAVYALHLIQQNKAPPPWTLQLKLLAP